MSSYQPGPSAVSVGTAQMSNITRLDTGYDPKIEPLKELKLPIELRNHRGETIASIFYSQEFGYGAHVNDHSLTWYRDFTECLRAAFTCLYTQMQDYRKIAEKHDRLADALRETLKTPFNNL
jgi:hypothetical protein